MLICLPLAVLLEDSPDSGARYLLKQNHSDSDSLPSMSMIFRIFAFDSEEESKKAFIDSILLDLLEDIAQDHIIVLESGEYFSFGDADVDDADNAAAAADDDVYYVADAF